MARKLSDCGMQDTFESAAEESHDYALPTFAATEAVGEPPFIEGRVQAGRPQPNKKRK
jgi:hypothetical protein